MSLVSEAALIKRYFGNVVASSSRTPPAQRVQAALAGGLFRSAAAALNPGQVGVAEALELLHQDDVVFVDTRDSSEVAKTGARMKNKSANALRIVVVGFVPGAVRIPRQMLVLRSDALSRTHTKLVAYDSTDARSLQAGQVLRSLGFKDVFAMPGYRAWADAGGPIQELQAPTPPPLQPHTLCVPAAALA